MELAVTTSGRISCSCAMCHLGANEIHGHFVKNSTMEFGCSCGLWGIRSLLFMAGYFKTRARILVLA